MHLVDSSILIAILTAEPKTSVWGRGKLDELRSLGGVFINQIVFSEICAFAESEDEASSVLSLLVERVDFPWPAAWPAGKACALYKSRGGRKTRMLPDFLIAAHAQILGWSLITNNPGDIRGYFPKLKIIHP